ncbi:MAG TPA: ABC transporter permease [Candidatus Krumholzibacteria bacterium]|nr:ABC transporter permease [Candidatus Krumholzibacteria bacterium]HRX50630.1 ABC transporter permease [Candidatus Krumholzibacteria bacterium]
MFRSSLTLALRAIRRNLMRSFLTILGIVIGVAAVIIMVTLGEGATAQVRDGIASMGSNLMMVRPGQRLGPGRSDGAKPFAESDGAAILAQVPDVAAIAPVAGKGMQAVFGNRNWSTEVTGTTADYLDITNRKLAAGRVFSDGEMRAGGAVAVIGRTTATSLFGDDDPIGQRLRLENLACEVIGLLEAKGQNTMGRDQDDVVIVPLATYQRRIAGNRDVSMFQLSVRDGADTERVTEEITAVLRDVRRLASNAENDFSIMDTKEIAAMLTGTTQLLTTLLSAVAAVSLLVGGIGIMNIMLVSVTERTREIGIRLAIGALERDVLTQFLVESVVLSSLGGLIGIAAALGVSVWATGALGVPFLFNGRIVAVAFLFSALVGVVFGYVPALRAARLDPIDALRRE